MSLFTRMRNRVEAPLQLAGAHIVRADVAGRRRQVLTDPPADDHQVLIDNAWRRQQHGLRITIAPELFAQIDPSTTPPEFWNWSTGRRVERVDVRVLPRENARMLAVGPVHDAAIGTTADDARIERPSAHARRCVERDDFMGRRQRIQQAIDDQGARLETALLTRVVRPGDLKGPNV